MIALNFLCLSVSDESYVASLENGQYDGQQPV